MQVSRAIDISLRALVVLAGEPERPTTIDRLANELDVPTRYLGKTIQRLAALGWVETSRGKGGGIRISAAGREVSVAEVIKTLDDNRPVVDCHEPLCPLLAKGCRLQCLFMRAEAAFLEGLRTVRVADLC